MQFHHQKTLVRQAALRVENAWIPPTVMGREAAKAGIGSPYLAAGNGVQFSEDFSGLFHSPHTAMARDMQPARSDASFDNDIIGGRWSICAAERRHSLSQPGFGG
jgi:hypothetical protein